MKNKKQINYKLCLGELGQIKSPRGADLFLFPLFINFLIDIWMNVAVPKCNSF